MSYKQDGHSCQFTSVTGPRSDGVLRKSKEVCVRPERHWSLSDYTLVTSEEKALFLLENGAALCPTRA